MHLTAPASVAGYKAVQAIELKHLHVLTADLRNLGIHMACSPQLRTAALVLF